MEYSLSEKKQLVLNSYKNAFDYDMALSVYDVTTDERKEMEADSLFWMEIKMAECELKESLIVGLRELAESKKENVRHEAIKTLGKIVYPEVFNRKEESEGTSNNVFIYLPDNGRGEGSATHGTKQVKGTVEVKKDVSKEV